MKKTIALTLAIITVLMLALSLASCGTNSPEGLAKAIANAWLKPDSEKFDSYKLHPDSERIKAAAKEKGLTEKEYLKQQYVVSSLAEYFEYQDESQLESWEEKYGKYDYEIKTVSVVELTSEELTEFKKYRLYNSSDPEKIDAAANCQVRFHIDGEEQSTTGILKFVIVRYDGKWKFYGWDLWNNPFQY